jgi:HSP20 family molecular chaperone IbpA
MYRYNGCGFSKIDNTLSSFLETLTKQFPETEIDNIFEKVSEDDKFNLFSKISKNENVKHTLEQSTVELDLPGYKKENIKIKVENKVLIVSVDGARGKKNFEYKINDVADTSRITSTLLDGVLTIIIPVKEDARPKSFEVPVN